jgi:AcrR family transcriptional regulator
MPRVKRNYDASRRQAAARQTRARILDAARTRFLRDGYGATTVAEIAADADVAPQTVTKQFNNKPGLVRALFEVALVGDDDGTPLEERTGIMAIHQEPDPNVKLRMFATALAAMLPRTAPIQLLLRQASGDPDLATVWTQIRAGRLVGMTNVANNLATGNHLRPGLTPEEARDILWTYSSPDLYELLVMNRGWDGERFRDFLTAALTAALLPDG